MAINTPFFDETIKHAKGVCELEDVLSIQLQTVNECEEGTLEHEYMRGLYNGMIVSLNILDNQNYPVI